MGFWYQNGYVRTSSKRFSLDNLEASVHLTNDAVQKNYDDYGKFEIGNKLSFSELQKYLQNIQKADFSQEVLPKIKKLIQDSLQATYNHIDKFKR